MGTDRVSARVDRTFEAYLFDLDGTVYLGDRLLPGAGELMAAIAAAGRRRAFVTNNSTRTRQMYADKLGRLGLEATADDIVTSGSLTAAWIRRHRPGAVCFVLGEEPLRRELGAAGLELSSDPARITLVVSSFDRGFDYAKLQIAFDALRGRPEVGFIATHPDPYCPLPDGRGQPDAAAVTAAVAACSGRTCQAVIGKPSATMVTTACQLMGVSLERTIVVGDRLATDIAGGLAAGAHTALVLTGDTSLADLAAAGPQSWPDHVLERIDALVPPLLALAGR